MGQFVFGLSVVTGVSVVTPIGNDADVFYNNLLEGVNGISEI